LKGRGAGPTKKKKKSGGKRGSRKGTREERAERRPAVVGKNLAGGAVN